jgi:hypothetical protein
LINSAVHTTKSAARDLLLPTPQPSLEAEGKGVSMLSFRNAKWVMVGVCLWGCALPGVEGDDSVDTSESGLRVDPNVIIQWNQNAFDTFGPCALNGSNRVSRTMAIVQAAVYDVVQSVESRYDKYKIRLQAPRRTSIEAAAAGAAHGVLVRFCPSQAATLATKLDASIAHVPPGEARTNGLKLGDQMAAAYMTLRSTDGAAEALVATYTPTVAPGFFQAMPPSFSTAFLAPTWGNITPWVVQSGAQFRSRPPYSIESPEFAADFNEVKSLGRSTGSTRTEFNTNRALFWSEQGSATINRVGRLLAARHHLDFQKTVRFFNHLNLAMGDGNIASWESKYHYHFWRPVTAIWQADTDNNPATAQDTTWAPLLPTPNMPEWPSAHCTMAGAGATVLRAYFGDWQYSSFTIPSSIAGTTPRTFHSITELEADPIEARIEGGIHYRQSDEAGTEQGNQIGTYVLKNSLRGRGGLWCDE